MIKSLVYVKAYNMFMYICIIVVQHYYNSGKEKVPQLWIKTKI